MPTCKNKIKFSDMLQVKKGGPYPPEVNAIPFAAVQMTGDDDLIKDFKDAEAGHWFGKLKSRNFPGLVFSFRRGVCQSLTKPKTMRSSDFDMNIVNENVNFSKDDSK